MVPLSSSFVRRAVAESVAGCAGGACKSVALYPLDLATTRREVGLPAFAANESVAATCFRGVGVCVALLPLYALLFHTAYACFPAGQDLLGSAAGAVAASVVGVPAECAKKRVQLGAKRRDAFRGGATLFDGYGATLLRNVPYNAVNFGAFRLLRQAFGARLSAPLCGFLAGCATAVATHPLDVALTQIQTARLRAARLQPVGPTLRRILFQDRTFFRGLLVRLLAYAPSSLLFFAVFDPLRLALSSFLSPLP